MRFKILALLGLVLFLADISQSLGRETNASRFRRGLPPLPPRFVLRNRGTTASITMSSSPSSTPRPQLSGPSGRIQVFAGNVTLGFVRNAIPINSLNLHEDPERDLRVQAVSERAPFDLVVTNSNFPAPLYVGALAPRNLGIHELSTVALSNVDRVRSNSRGTTWKGFTQSAIWSINSSTRKLEAQYLNPDGSKSPLLVQYDVHENELRFVGDIDSTDPDFPMVKLYLSED